MKRISGKEFDIRLGNLMIHVLSFTNDITDNTKAVSTKGVPNGWVSGDVESSGEIELDTQNFNLVCAAAKKAGSFEDMETFDIVANASAAKEEFKFEAFGCKLLVTSPLGSVDQKGGDVQKHKLKYLVTSPDFVRINGTPYLSKDSTKDIH